MAVTAAGITSADRSHLERTVALGWEARNRGDHPFGSLLVVADGRVLEAHNSVVTGSTRPVMRRRTSSGLPGRSTLLPGS